MGRPLNKKWFGPTGNVQATATFDTLTGDEGGTAATIDDPSNVTVNITDGGSGYTPSTIITVATIAATGGGTIDIDFTVDATGVVISGAAKNFVATITVSTAGQSVTIPAPDNASNFKIIGTAYFTGEGAEEACYIVRQRSSKRYEVADVATGLLKETMPMVDGDDAIVAGEFKVEVDIPGGGSNEHARKITSRRVSTYEGNSWGWGELDLAGPGTDV